MEEHHHRNWEDGRYTIGALTKPPARTSSKDDTFNGWPLAALLSTFGEDIIGAEYETFRDRVDAT